MVEESRGQSYQYLDFSIEITEGDGGRYPVSVHSTGGDADESIAFPFEDVNELSRYLDKLQIALLRSARAHRQLSDEEVIVREFGEKLFRALFTQQIRSCYDRSLALAQSQGKGLRIRLDIEADELAGLPWEFLFDPEKEDYLSLSANTPVVRYLDCNQSIPPMEIQLPLQVLGMISSPADLDPLDVAQEKANLEKALQPLIKDGLAKLTWLPDGSWRSLLDALNRGPWHIFHFVGHGDYDEEKHEGLVAFEGANNRAQHINAGQLARLLGEHAYLRVVLLNACESGQSGKEDVFSSTAATLLKRGVPAVIAMQYSISDQAAIELSQTFYKCLAAGLPVDAAISRARLALSFAVNNTLEWGTPVLLMRTEDGVLFNLKPPKEGDAQPKEAARDAQVEMVEPLTRLTVAPALELQAPPLEKLPVVERAVVIEKAGIETAQPAQSQPAAPPKTASRGLKNMPWTWLAGGALAIVLLATLCGLAGAAISRSIRNGWATKTALAYAGQITPSALVVVSATTAVPSQALPIVVPTTESPAAPTTEAAPPTTVVPTTAVPATALPTNTDTPIPIPTRTQLAELMAQIPAGSFQMGNDEKGYRNVDIDTFYIDKYEVSNVQFAAFLNEHRYQSGSGSWLSEEDARLSWAANSWRVNQGNEKLPVTGATWYGAQAYCEWLGGSLPSGEQWEKAARGKQSRNEKYPYPWGEQEPDCLGGSSQGANTRECGFGEPLRYDYFSPTYYDPNDLDTGLYHMIGNVWEWLSDDATGVARAAFTATPSAQEENYYFIRGGAFSHYNNYAHVFSTAPANARGGYDNVGFRCVYPVRP